MLRLADGRIIEGNRRWNEALDSHNNGEGGPSYIEVAFLEEELSDADILEIEATFQYEPETKSYYKPIEDAQLFRELRKHFSMDYIVNRFNLSEKKIQLRIDTLNLIDDYLSRIGKPSHYSLVTELSSFTSFEEAQKNLYKFVDETPETEQMFRVSSLNTISLGILTKRDNKIGQKRLEENQGNKTDKELTFEHRDIRGLYTIFQDEEARLKLIQHMEPSKIFTLEEMEEKKEQVVSDIYEARMECETNLHLDEPNRLLSLINSNLKKIKTIPSEAGRDEFLNRIKFTTQQMRRILNLVANPIQQEE